MTKAFMKVPWEVSLVYIFIFLTYRLDRFSIDVDPETGWTNYPRSSSDSEGKPRS